MLRLCYSKPLRMFLQGQMLAGLIFCTYVSAAATPAKPRILGKGEVIITGGEIFLGDLLRFESVDSSLREQLTSAIMSLAPQPGKTRILAGAEVFRKLESFGVTQENYSIEVPEEITVSRRSRILGFADLQNTVIQQFLPGLPWKEVSLEKLEVPEPVLLPEGEPGFTFEYSPRSDLARPFYLTVKISVDGEVVKRLFLRTVLKIEDTVAVAASELTPAQALGPEEVRWEKRKLDSTTRSPILGLSFLEGKKPRTVIPAGQVLTEDLLIRAPLVKRGDTITLIYQDDRMRIKTQVKSLATGMRGDQIQVMNLDSKKIVKAEILDQTSARVVF
jgi:flagella basal body P-ring formation protein FlgA